MSRLARPIEALAPAYDAVVVGSGYGGGVAASRLARAGLRVAVLERGREIRTGEFPSRFPELRHEVQVTAASWRMGASTALYDVRLGRDMHVIVGCGLGGGSLINGGVALRPDPRVFADRVWPGQLRQDASLDEGFARASAWLRPAIHEGAETLDKFRAFVRAAEALGRRPAPPPVAVSFAPTVNAAGIAQPACTLCGDCCAGCNVGAKNTVAITYLPDAQRHGAELFTCLQVRDVVKSRDGQWEVTVDRLDRDATAPIVVRAALVVLAGGTLGSTEILLRSRQRGLGLSDRLGHRFSANGDLIAFGYGSKTTVNGIGVGHPSRVEGRVVGASVSGQLDIEDPDTLENEIRIQEGAAPSAMAPMLPVLFLPNGRLLGALQSLVSGVYDGPFKGMQTFFAVSHDSAGGQLRLDGERLDVSWPGAANEPVFARLDAVLSSLVGALGGNYVKNPMASVMGQQPATAHPLGGCGMGEDRISGVVDHRGRVFDADAGRAANAVHDGLYVIDGSTIPRSLGVNPLLTITALAERAMLHMADERGLRFSAA